MIRLFEGDSLDVLRATPDGTYTYVISDPPYGLSTPPDPLEVMRQWLADGDFHRKVKGSKGKAGGFMGAEWDHFVPGPVLWREVFRTCKPGAIVLCFAATRTMDWMSLSLRCAGFEILDTIAWLQAQGMAKAGTLDKKIDARNGDERPITGVNPSSRPNSKKKNGGGFDSFQGEESAGIQMLTAPASAESAAWAGWSTQLAPGYEPIIVARRPCEGTATANVLKHGCGAMNIDACRIATTDDLNGGAYAKDSRKVRGDHTFSMGVAEAEFKQPAGRWPKNVMLSAEAAAVLDATVPHSRDGVAVKRNTPIGKVTGQIFKRGNTGIDAGYGGGGGVSRFFWVGPLATADDTASPARYVPKVRTAERHAGLPDGMKSTHPTVKPQALMEWLCRLVGHPQGRGLDPFAGSGSTLRAARALGLAFDGIERDPTFAEIARHRAGIHGEAPASPTPGEARMTALMKRLPIIDAARCSSCGGECCKRMPGSATPADFPDLVEQLGFVTIEDPAVGSGTTLLAAAAHALELGVNPQTQMRFHGRDISASAVHMAFVNCSLRGLPAIIEHGDTLRMEIWSRWVTPMFLMGGWKYRRQRQPETAPREILRAAVGLDLPDALLVLRVRDLPDPGSAVRAAAEAVAADEAADAGPEEFA